MSAPGPELVLVRHGETEWSRDKRHTGRTDVPLTEDGRRDAERLRGALAGMTFDRVLCSPLARARETCALAGLGERAELDADLLEWDYGVFEGRTTADIRTERPGWSIWSGPWPGGESLDDVGTRADRVLGALRGGEGRVLLVAHGHFLRILAARWIELPPVGGARLVFQTGCYGTLGWEREVPALTGWNLVPA